MDRDNLPEGIPGDPVLLASSGTPPSTDFAATSTEAAGPSATHAATPTPPSAAPQSRYEHFEIARREDGSLWKLGSGAMGTTYKAVDTRLHYHVALKVIRADLSGRSPEARARFLREARMAASVHHPNIASVFHLGELPDGQCFYAMEFVEGETLAERVQRDGPQPIFLALEIALQVTRALAAASRLDLIHRDIKPANLMLTKVGTEAGHIDANGSDSTERPPLVKVIDFGLARTIRAGADAPLTVSGDFVGTPAFASPEQLASDDDPIDGRSDIFSLGSTLWYLLTGKQPFAGRSFEEIRTLQLRSRPVKQLQQAAVPAPVIALLRAMLAVDPDQRPQTPAVLADMIVRCRRELAGTTAGGPGGGQIPGDARAREVAQAPQDFSRSRRVFVDLTVVAGVLAVAGLAGSIWMVKSGKLAPAPATSPAIAAAPATLASAAPERSIAVLPFTNLSADPANAYFADGVQDEILTDLARIAELKVISRTSVVQYKSSEGRNLREIGAQLGVANVLEGSVQRIGNTVRVTAQLIDARNDAHLWADRYDRPLENVFAIQSEIAQAIAGQLQARLSAQEKAAITARPTNDFQAYDLYLHARVLYSDTGNKVYSGDKLPRAARVLDEALARDPAFLSAWCLLARVHCSMFFWGFDHTPSRLEQARVAVEAALRLQPESGEAHLASAIYYYFGFRDYVRARAELDLARRALPNEAEVYAYTGYIARREGRWTDSTRDLERALELDPRNFFILQQVATSYQLLHRYADAGRIYERALAIVPGDATTRILNAELAIDAHADVQPFQTARAALVREDPNSAAEVDDSRAALSERTPEAAARFLASSPATGVIDSGMMYPHAYWEGVVARWEGDALRARAAFTSARKDVQAVVANQPDFAAANSLLGIIDAGLGNNEAALASGRRACDLLPVGKDAIDGPLIATNMAQILAWTGNKTAAIEQLAAIEKLPNALSYGMLKIHPIWDDLRGDARFEALVASLAPKLGAP